MDAGRFWTTEFTYTEVSSCRRMSESTGSVEGALDRASATSRLFPGTCEMVKSKRIIHSRNLCTLIGSLSMFFEENNGTSGL